MSRNSAELPSGDNINDVVDRRARDALAAAIRQFLDSKLSAFAFSDALFALPRSSDEVVRFVMGAVWYFYDDCHDHMVRLTKQGWHYFQRLLLLLDSERQIEVEKIRHWSWTQLVALGSLFALGWCVWRFGWGWYLFFISIPCGLISLIISLPGREKRTIAFQSQMRIPLSTFSEIRATYRTARSFRKKQYPGDLTVKRHPSGAIMPETGSGKYQFDGQLHAFAMLLQFSPILLLFQVLPLTETRLHLRPASSPPCADV